ncbi:hypothetical protein GCM10023115_45390 [Pontixanthobacter gangjinensis]|uniref:Uncharacterized protein n=1 Tax=Christiangramia aestuarii TaxID=1028746 RepID=A0A7M3SXN6_9FLAO|nr:hypothetical protein [Christiangramia aestuarii]MUP41367.1 hypothetical protein [Christiangramia aestuarii]
MRIFKEEQAFRQWWIILVLGSTLVVTSIPLINSLGDNSSGSTNLLGLCLVLLIIVLFWVIRLKTKIDARGIRAEFRPLKVFKRQYKWEKIEDCYVRQYLPVQEYGGWGIRGFGKAKAYNVSGNMGIQIITKDNEKFLIGTNKPEKAQKVIARYREKFKTA